MKTSESINELASALSKFQGEVTNPKNTANNPQFQSKYAPLQDILSLTRPILSKQGLSVLQSTTGDLENVTISTMLLHSSGQFMETESFTLKGEQTARGGAKVLNVQGAGSMITYIRRYQLTAILGLASEDDDDGNHASKKKEEVKKVLIDKDKVSSIKALAEKKGIKEVTICAAYKITKFEQMDFNNWKAATDKLNLKPDHKNELEGLI